MTVYTFANLGAFAQKTRERMDAVVKQSANDVFAMASRTAPGVTRGGTVVPGFVPRDTGFLAASAVASLNGSSALTGENAYVFAVAQMKAGDTAEMGWTAAYARVAHYRGWLFVETAANAWPQIVAAAVARAMAR
jgi:hypothetical protein